MAWMWYLYFITYKAMKWVFHHSNVSCISSLLLLKRFGKFLSQRPPLELKGIILGNVFWPWEFTCIMLNINLGDVFLPWEFTCITLKITINGIGSYYLINWRWHMINQSEVTSVNMKYDYYEIYVIAALETHSVYSIYTSVITHNLHSQ